MQLIMYMVFFQDALPLRAMHYDEAIGNADAEN